MPSLTFSLLSFGNLLAIYRKQAPCLSKALTYCFMRPSLIWRGGSITFEGSTRARLEMFLCPGVHNIL